MRHAALGLLALLALGVPPAATAVDEERWPLVLAAGRVIDPASGRDGVAWVGIRDGRIGAVSETPLRGDETVDVRGLAVTPGFIDLHIHGQEPRSYDFLVRDGVTTALELEAGAQRVRDFLARRDGRVRVHVGASAGHMPARARVIDGVDVEHFLTARQMENGPRLWWAGLRMLWRTPRFGHAQATPAQRDEILASLARELDDGAIGIGMGLAYTPGADEAEIGAVFTLAAERGVPVFVHLPAQADPSDEAPLRTVLDLARASGASLHVVHVNSSSMAAVDAYLAAIDAARADGLDVTTEAYPYTAGSTRLESALFDDGWRERRGLDYGDLQWAETGERLTAETFARYRTRGGTVIIHGNTPERVATAIAHPGVLVASDGMPMVEPSAHPRGAGTRARILATHVRERGDLSLMAALHKMSIGPARRLEGFVPAMRRKGRLEVGADADLVVFDPARVQDRATFEAPHRASEGIPHVLVQGEFVVRDGDLVEGAFPGRALRAEAGSE